jgi:hypothetical protein
MNNKKQKTPEYLLIKDFNEFAEKYFKEEKQLQKELQLLKIKNKKIEKLLDIEKNIKNKLEQFKNVYSSITLEEDDFDDNKLIKNVNMYVQDLETVLSKYHIDALYGHAYLYDPIKEKLEIIKEQIKHFVIYEIINDNSVKRVCEIPYECHCPSMGPCSCYIYTGKVVVNDFEFHKALKNSNFTFRKTGTYENGLVSYVADFTGRVDNNKYTLDLSHAFTVYNRIKVNVKTLVGKTILLDVHPTDSIFDVKQQIHEKEDISPFKQRLFYDQKELEIFKTLLDYKIYNDCSISLVVNE